MFSVVSVAALALSALTATAAPVPARRADAGCSSSAASAVPNFPAGQTNLSVPAGQTVEFIAVGRGTQNYTCGPTGTWSLQGALATLADVTCLYSSMDADQFASIPQAALALPNPPDFASSTDPVLSQIPAEAGGLQLGSHYFITEPTGSTPSGNQPKFDFTDGDAADTTKYVTVTKTAFLDDPTDKTKNVQWLQLAAIPNQGSLAASVFRVDTAGGQPSTTTCTAGDSQNVDYAALYYFYH